MSVPMEMFVLDDGTIRIDAKRPHGTWPVAVGDPDELEWLRHDMSENDRVPGWSSDTRANFAARGAFAEQVRRELAR